MDIENLKLPQDTPVMSLAYSASRNLLAVGQMGEARNEPSLSIWDLSNKKSIHSSEENHYSNIRAMSFDHTGERLIYSSNDKLFLFDINSNEKHEIGSPNQKITKIVSSRTSPRMIVSGKHATVYDIETEETLWTLQGYEAFSTTQNLSIHGLPTEWNVTSHLADFKNEPAIVEIFDDGNNIIVGGHNKGKIEMINIISGETYAELFPAPIQASSMSLGCNQKILAVSSKIPYANFIWDLESGNRILPDLFNERFGGYSSLCLHPKEKRLASGSLVGFVSVQSLEDGKFIVSEQVHAGRVSQVIFSQNAETLISGGEDGQVHLIKTA